ncbi:MAG: universal stress protein [Candidatus Nanopelagicales bacterium]|nr:universal stress protein [Candidatus Nanopelagicales bacterium]
MLIAIGVTPDESSGDALALGAVLCRSLGADPVLVHVYPEAYDPARVGHVDAEWTAFLREQAADVLAEATEEMAEAQGFAGAATAMHGHRSSGVGLNETATALGADMIVVGSSSGASNGRFQVGSTADQLLHGSAFPVCLAPVGYRRTAPRSIGRIVVAFQNTTESQDALLRAVELAECSGSLVAPLTVLVRHRTYGSDLGSAAEQAVIAEQREEAEASQARALRDVPASLRGDSVIAVGDSPLAALQRLDWRGDEVLLLSSSKEGKIMRVFLGDMTYKLIRATPVPAIVLPRRT